MTLSRNSVGLCGFVCVIVYFESLILWVLCSFDKATEFWE